MKKLMFLFKVLTVVLVFNSLNVNATEKSPEKYSKEKSEKFAEMIFDGPKEMDFKEFIEKVRAGIQDPEIDINYYWSAIWKPLNSIIASTSYNADQRFEVFKELLSSNKINLNPDNGMTLFIINYQLFGKHAKEALKLLIKNENSNKEFFDPILSQMYEEIKAEMSVSPAPEAPPAPMPQLPGQQDKGDSKQAAESGK